MSMTLLKFALSFSKGRISAPVFVDSYQEIWMIERDSGLLNNDPDDISEALSTIFCAADCFNPGDKRFEGDLDEDQLREEVTEILSKIVV